MDYTKIAELAEEYTDASAQFLRDIIAIPSTSTNEGPVIQRIGEEMNAVGFDEVRVDGMGNIHGRIGNGKHLIAMDGHIDTVDVGNVKNWQHDPFKGKLENGIIYGRGASDMKGAMAALVYAGKIIKQAGLEDDYTLLVTGTVQEEDCDGLCWQYIVKEEKIVPEVVVITEPTNLQIYRGHRGRMELEIIVEGISCHGSAPERGENAIYKMAPIIEDIEQLNERLSGEPFLGKGTVTISQIRSGSPSLCAVADMAAIYLDRRLALGDTIESVKKELEALASFQKAGAKVVVPEYEVASYTGLKYPTQKYYPTWLLEEDHPALDVAKKTYRNVFGKEAVPSKWVFSTNGVATMGMHGIPTIGFGPANEIHAHSVDDQCPVWHLTDAMKFYAAFPKAFIKNT